MAIVYNSTPKPLSIAPLQFVPKELQQQLPRGLAIPLRCSNNIWDSLSGTQKIKQNIYLTIMTPVGRALMQPDFGTIIPYCLFEPATPLLIQQMTESIAVALKKWVPTITVQKIIFDGSFLSQHIMLIDTIYTVNGTSAQETSTVGYTTPDDTQFAPSTFMVNDKAIFGKA